MAAAASRCSPPAARGRRRAERRAQEVRRQGLAGRRQPSTRAAAGRPATAPSWEEQLRTRAQAQNEYATPARSTASTKETHRMLQAMRPAASALAARAGRRCGGAAAGAAAPHADAARRRRPRQPAGAAAPAEPQPDETNAQRARTQPGNNAPFWRGVRESGTHAGLSPTCRAPRRACWSRSSCSTPARASPPPARRGGRCATTGSFPYGGVAAADRRAGDRAVLLAQGPARRPRAATPARLIERFTYFERAVALDQRDRVRASSRSRAS